MELLYGLFSRLDAATTGGTPAPGAMSTASNVVMTESAVTTKAKITTDDEDHEGADDDYSSWGESRRSLIRPCSMTSDLNWSRGVLKRHGPSFLVYALATPL